MAQVAFADRLTLPPDSTGKPTGMFPVAVTGGTLYLPASVLTDASGNAVDATHPLRVDPTGATTQPVSAASLPLPTSAAQEHTAAASPSSARLTDGAAFYDGRQVRALTSSDVVTSAQGTPAVQANAWFLRPRKLATYRAVVRVAASPFAMANVFGAAGRKQFATIHHASSATKTVKLKRAQVFLSGTSAGAFITFELRRITTAPATGNPAITPSKADTSDAAAEATVLALPTTAATEEAQPYSAQAFNLGITGTGSTVSPAPPIYKIDLLDPTTFDDEAKAPAVRAGVLEGFAVTCDVNAATTVTVAFIVFEFTEE